MRKSGLYIHIPFCVKKCNYCDFYSLGYADSKRISGYTDALCTQIEREAPSYTGVAFDSVFLGGGTPSLLSVEDISHLFKTVRDSLYIAENAEITIEANPDTITEERLKAWRECGINRLSIGLQSTDNEMLKTLGRIHSFEDFKRGFVLARELGFDNINVDLMYALPNQSTNALIKTLECVCELSPDHISAYCLKIEPSTPFSKMELALPDEDTQYEMYNELCTYLSSQGYEQYEISNFAKNGHRCAHNLKYWQREEYVGLGPCAHSFFDGVRYSYEGDTSKYIAEISSGGVPDRLAEECNELTLDEKIDEYVMLRLRLCDGVDENEFKTLFGKELFLCYDFDKYVQSGHMKKTKTGIAFTPKGFFVSNYILSQILEHI